MKPLLLSICFLLSINAGFSQEDDGRSLLRGQVLHRNMVVPDENVINATSEMATITNANGEFLIRVKEGDELVFSAVNFNLRMITVTEEILRKGRLVVEVEEKITKLDEVVVTSEEQEKFLEVKNDQFKQYEYEIDRSSEVENIAMPQYQRGMKDGVNFVNIFKALVTSNNKIEEEKRPPLKLSDVMRQVYDDRFFMEDLQLPQDKIDAFLLYCDLRIPTRTLLRKENEFELIEFLVNQSKIFLSQIDEEK